jgi:ATP-binding protein involved in chromosome partitioning
MYPNPIRSHSTQLPHYALKNIKNAIAIASGKGGVGKSTVAVNLAVTLAQHAGARVGLLDADIYGPSAPTMMGATHEALETVGEFYRPMMLHGVQTMSMGLLTATPQALIWRGPMLAKALLHMLNTTAWDDLDYLIIDLPPGTGDIALSLVQKIPLAGAIIVTTPQTVATLDADKAIQMFQTTQIPILGLIENMALHTCSACGHQEAIFGQGGARALAELHQLPWLGQLPLHQAIRQGADEGTPAALSSDIQLRQPWENIALKMSQILAERPTQGPSLFNTIKTE